MTTLAHHTQIHVNRISNINGSGYVVTIGGADENTYRGKFYRTRGQATQEAVNRYHEALKFEGLQYTFHGLFDRNKLEKDGLAHRIGSEIN